MEFTPVGKAAFNPGKNLVAIHCHQDQGGQYVDFGFVTIEPAPPVANLTIIQ